MNDEPNGNVLVYRVNKLEEGQKVLAADVDAIKSVIDQLRGAKALIYFLVGSNVLLAVTVVAGLVR